MEPEGTCNLFVYWWDGEYEGNCELPKDHPPPHFDGMSYFNDDLEDVTHEEELKQINKDVQRYAEFIAGHRDAATPRHREAARAVLLALIDEGRLLPPGGVTRVEYGVRVLADGEPSGIMAVGTSEWCRKNGTHQRTVTSWVAEGQPNNQWPKYTSAWEEIKR